MLITELISKIVETGDNPLPYRLGEKLRNANVYVSDELKLEVLIYRLNKSNAKQSELEHWTERHNRLNIGFTVDNSIEITGTGNAVKILSTVHKILQDNLVSNLRPDTDIVMFSADNNQQSRVRLYKRLAPYITNILGSSWKFMIEPQYGLVHFIWLRP